MDRRTFLQWGTAGVVGADLLGPCTDDTKRNGPPGPPPTTATPPSSSGTGPAYLALTKTAASLESMLVAAYEQLTQSRLVTQPALLTLSTTFAAHHAQHLAALNGIITATNGQAPVSAPNEVMQNQI